MNSNIIILSILIILAISITAYISVGERLPIKGIINQDNTETLNQFRVPKYIPTGYQLYTSSNVPPQMLEIEYRGVDANDWISFVADIDDPNVEKGEQLFLDYKAEIQRETQRGDRIQIFKINGNPAMGWEAGTKDSILLFDNGTRKVIGESKYNAGIAMIDEKEKVYYSISSPNLSLDELKKMLESIYQ
ncbi:MAG: DUF4367 domain-containing protein [Candidatus Nitrosocaldaceae archaeon]